MNAAMTALVGLVILVGLVGIVIPVLPGLLLCWAAIGVWALVEASTAGWVVFGFATALLVASQIVKLVVPGRQMREAGVPLRSIVIGGIAGIVGFFVIPLVGLFVGFLLGVYGAERLRLGAHAQAWPSTLHALKVVGVSILIELGAGLLMAAAWLVGVIFF